MAGSKLRTAIIGVFLALAAVAAQAGDREIFFNDVQVSEHNISVIEQSYGISFESGRYWYDRSSGLWGSEGGGPEGRIAAGLHLGGPAPAEADDYQDMYEQAVPHAAPVANPPAAQDGLELIPRGETVRVSFEERENVEIELDGHRFKLRGGARFSLTDERSGASYPLRAGRNVIGRHSGNQVVVEPTYISVSRKHLIVEPLSETSALITDISSHGTWITHQSA